MRASLHLPSRWLLVVLATVVLLSTAMAGSAAAATDLGPNPSTIHNVSATQSLTFSPYRLRIHVGDTVVWTNTSTNIQHTVTSNTNAWTSSGPINPGGTFQVTFNTPGTYKYHCQFHVSFGMKGKIVVR